MNIYLKDATNFENNGLGFLNDLISAKVTECLTSMQFYGFIKNINSILSSFTPFFRRISGRKLLPFPPARRTSGMPPFPSLRFR